MPDVGNFNNFNFKIVSQINLDSKAMQLLILVVLLLVISFLIDYFLSHSFIGKKYRIFVGLGVVLHEFSHAFFCIITGAKISKISLFDKEGGRVEHTPSRVPILGSILISYSPLFIGLVAIFYLSRFIGLNDINISFFPFNNLNIMDKLLQLISLFNFTDIKSWAIFYLTISIIVTMTPSLQDFKNSIFPSILLIAILAVASYFINFHTFFEGEIILKLFVMLSTILLLLIFSLLLSIIIYVFSKIFKL